MYKFAWEAFQQNFLRKKLDLKILKSSFIYFGEKFLFCFCLAFKSRIHFSFLVFLLKVLLRVPRHLMCSFLVVLTFNQKITKTMNRNLQIVIFVNIVVKQIDFSLFFITNLDPYNRKKICECTSANGLKN